jgi:hypothetical protein
LCKGFGFITCGDEKTYKKILNFKGKHKVLGRQVDVNIAYNFNEIPDKQTETLKKKKIFVGAISNGTNNGKSNLTFQNPLKNILRNLAK